MADALSRYRQAPPSKDALQRYRQEPSGDTLGALAKYLGLQGYWDRQGQIAQEGLTMADEGARAVRGGNLSGLGGLALGPLSYFASPLTALLPTPDEVQNASDLPEWSKPVVSAVNNTAQFYMPGPGELGAVASAVKPAMFLGVMAKNADKAKLARAVELETAGKSPAIVRGETGWFRGADGDWRFEIDDSTSKLKAAPDQLTAGSERTLGDVLDHPELYENYPQLASVPVGFNERLGGSYSARTSPDDTGYFTVGNAADISNPKRRNDQVWSVTSHEVQHAVQDLENFATGGSPHFLKPGTPGWGLYREIQKNLRTPLSLEEYAVKAGFDSVDDARASYPGYLKMVKKAPAEYDRMAQETAAREGYRRSAGEVEARNVQTRLGWPQSERAVGPWVTEDVPRDKQIIQRGRGQ